MNSFSPDNGLRSSSSFKLVIKVLLSCIVTLTVIGSTFRGSSSVMFSFASLFSSAPDRGGFEDNLKIIFLISQ